MPEVLNTTDMCAVTVVLDNSRREEDNGEMMRSLFAETFNQDEYIYLDVKEFDIESEDAAKGLLDIITTEKQNCRLKDTGANIAIVFYEDIRFLNDEHIASILKLQNDFFRLTQLPGAIKTAYLCIFKDKCNGSSDMAKRLRNIAINPMPGIHRILIDGQPMSTIRPYAKSTVRLAHLASRNNAISRMNPLAEESTLWNFVMIEYDEDELEELKKRKKELTERLESNELGFDLSLRVQELCGAYIRGVDGAMLRARDVPIPSDCIGKVFPMPMGSGKMRSALQQFSSTLSDSYNDSTHKTLCDEAEREDVLKGICRELSNDIPIGALETKAVEEAKRLSEGEKPVYSPYRPNLRPCIGVEKLYEQLEEEIRSCKMASVKYLSEWLCLAVYRYLPEYIRGEEITKRKRCITDELAVIGNRIATIGTAGDSQTFVRNSMTLLERKMALLFQTMLRQQSFMLISQRIFDKWDEKFAAYLPAELSGRVYNCGTLEEQEFQVCRLQEFGQEQLTDDAVATMFRLERGDMTL